MTARPRFAAPTLIVYWTAIVLGLALYTGLCTEDPWVTVPLWVGAIGGTLLGQLLALRDVRFAVIGALVFGLVLWGAPATSRSADALHFWMAFAPATVCGAASLADRGALAAFWFPAMLWMLSILDRAAGATVIHGSGAVLLGALAVVFCGFLYVREARRTSLWRTVATTPIVMAKPVVVLRQAPGAAVGRVGWAMLVSALAFVTTTWLAPRLWQLETFDGPDEVTDVSAPQAGQLPPCPSAETIAAERGRVREYLDLGRGRDRDGDRVDDSGPCDPTVSTDAMVARGEVEDGELYYLDPYVGGAGRGDAPVSVAPDRARGERHAQTYRGTPASRARFVDVTPGHGGYGAPVPAPDPAGELEPTSGPVSVADLPAPDPITDPSPSPIAEPAPSPASDPIAEPAPSPASDPIAEPAPSPAPASPPATTPHAALQEPAAPAPSATPTPAIPPRAGRPHIAAADPGGPLVHWLMLALAGALVIQLVRLGLRPLRRLVTLRHLRRPFWDETVHQRVSNWWQLVLVGLRDGGWRTTAGEQPCELARRTGVDGAIQCATILERARHGIGLDATDLADMEASAETAYRASRETTSPLARAASWFRRPVT